MRLLLLLAALLPASAADPPLRVLFIGNSLTYANDVPALVESIGKANGIHIETRTIAFPDYSLEDHWNQGESRRALARSKWNFVVLQQGPSSLPESRALLVDYTRRFAAEASRAGAKIALYMVWPSAARFRDFDGVNLSYQTAARAVGGVFLPAGEAWRAAWRENPDLRFYSSDYFHPSRLGSCLAAIVISQGLTGKAPLKIPSPTDADPKLLLQAAAEALQNR